MAATALHLFATDANADAAPPIRVEDPYIFTDEHAAIVLPDATDGAISFSHRVLTDRGWQASTTATARVEQNRLLVRPLEEGINVLTFADKREVRFLAFTPLAANVDDVQLSDSLPSSGKKLLRNEQYAILALGDSVTTTGEYPTILAKLLARATGNRQISVEKRAHAGRSIDATVRSFESDVPPQKPVDLALLMYGLNDQAASTGMDVYLDQTRWVHARLRDRGADLVLLQPTPHIDAKEMLADPAYPLRTIGFAEALRPLAAELRVPLADTFNALWAEQHRSIPESIRAMATLYPQSYSKPFTTLLEGTGAGDTIHPNALGHLKLARAAYAAIVGQKPSGATPELKATTRWIAGQMVTRVQVTNRSDQPWQGMVDLVPPQGTKLVGDLANELRLSAGEGRTLEVRWPELLSVEQIASPPYDAVFVRHVPHVHTLLTTSGRTRASAVFAPMSDGLHFRRGRHRIPADGKAAQVDVLDAAGQVRHTFTVPLPTTANTAYVPLVHTLEGQVVASDVYFVRQATASVGEATADGKFDEWNAGGWFDIALGTKPRLSVSTDTASATKPTPFSLSGAIRAGASEFHLALNANANANRDTFTLFFDPRKPESLGSVGPYFWVDCEVQPDGVMRLRQGETTPKTFANNTLKGAWRRGDDGRVHIEVTVPYAVSRTDSWPASGELGFGLVWHHRPSDVEKPSVRRYLWSDNAHWWTPIGYGVVRRQAEGNQDAAPWLVRVR